jgi:hypothetical protein
MKSKGHPTYKTNYSVANWPSSNRALVRRGEVTELSPRTFRIFARELSSSRLQSVSPRRTPRFLRALLSGGDPTADDQSHDHGPSSATLRPPAARSRPTQRGPDHRRRSRRSSVDGPGVAPHRADRPTDSLCRIPGRRTADAILVRTDTPSRDLCLSPATRTYERVTNSGMPVWLPDSRRILFVSRSQPSLALRANYGWAGESVTREGCLAEAAEPRRRTSHFPQSSQPDFSLKSAYSL